MQPKWFEWSQALQAIAQNGLAYSNNPFDIERFEAIRQIAAEMLSCQTGVDVERLENLFAGEEGYATPKVDVRGAIFRDDTILLVRENMDGGRWTLPGGWADVSDSPAEAVLREIREEAGYDARVLKLAAVYDRNRRGHPLFYFSIYKLFFICEITGGAPAASIETSEVAFFGEAALPELSIARVTPAEIHTLFEHHYNPTLPTEFD